MSIYEDIYNKSGLSESQKLIISLIKPGEKVLEVGSSGGYMTSVWKKMGCEVDVVEVDKDALERASTFARRAILGSIEDRAVADKLAWDYDVVVMADVLEHLVNPEKVLDEIKKAVKSGVRLVISMPNIASWPMRKQLFFRGDFRYSDSGLLDKTHLHFYTPETLKELVTDGGWKAERLEGGVLRYPLQTKLKRFGGAKLGAKLARRWPNLFIYHMVLVAVKG